MVVHALIRDFKARKADAHSLLLIIYLIVTRTVALLARTAFSRHLRKLQQLNLISPNNTNYRCNLQPSTTTSYKIAVAGGAGRRSIYEKTTLLIHYHPKVFRQSVSFQLLLHYCYRF